MGLKVEPKIFKKSLSSVDNVLKEVFPKLDPAYRNMMNPSKSILPSVSNPLYKTVSTADVQKELKMKNLVVDEFIKAEMP